ATSKYAAMWRRVRKYSAIGGLSYCVAHTVANYLGELVICTGPSMHPTIEDGDLVIAERLSIMNRTLRKGDIVGCLNPHDHTQLLCKRLAGLERDIVEPTEHLPHGRVPLGHCFLLGDNAPVSTDSRAFGPVPFGLVEVRLVLRVWPPSRAGWLSNHWFFEKEERKIP
ncbi:hypothetical protein PMAYCL1PPCAC_10022, partial [Pristionchus mayeri]